MAAKKATPMIDTEWYLTIKEVCDRSKYSRTQINMFIREKKLKVRKCNNGKVLIKYQDFADFMESIITRAS